MFTCSMYTYLFVYECGKQMIIKPVESINTDFWFVWTETCDGQIFQSSALQTNIFRFEKCKYVCCVYFCCYISQKAGIKPAHCMWHLDINFILNPQADSLLFAAMLLLLQPIQIEEVNPVFQIGGLTAQVTLLLTSKSQLSWY